MVAQPVRARAASGTSLHMRPEARAVIHLPQMRHFMRHHIIQHKIRRQDQPPGKRQRARRRTGAPAAGGIAHRDARRLARRAGRHDSSARASSVLRASLLKKSSTRRGACAVRPLTQITPSSRQTGAGPRAAARMSCGMPRNGTTAPGSKATGPGPWRNWPRDPVLFAARESPAHARRPRRDGAVTLTSPVAGLTLTIMRRARGLRRTCTSSIRPSILSSS